MITPDLLLTADLITLRRGERLSGHRRDQARQAVAELYARGMTVRQIAEKINSSYGRVHDLLTEAAIAPRGHGYRSVKARALPGTEPAR